MKETVCIVILTGYNPNVFYEMAVAHAAAKPTILLIEKGQPIPFDIKDIRVIEYDLRPRQLRDGVYKKLIVQHLEEFAAQGWRSDVPFGDGLSPLGNTSLFTKESDYGGGSRWVELVRNTKKSLDLCGIALTGHSKMHHMREALEEQKKKGVQIRILLSSPDNPALVSLMNQRDNLGSLERVKHEIIDSHTYFVSVLGDAKSVRFIKHGFPLNRIVRTDDFVFATPYFYALTTQESPMISTESGSEVYVAYTTEVDRLWNHNAPDVKT